MNREYAKHIGAIFCAVVLHGASLTSQSTDLATRYTQSVQWLAHKEASVVTRSLPNGLSVIFFPKYDTPDVFIQLVYRVGSFHERTVDEFGYAHLLEHMAFKGTQDGLNLSETDVQAIMEKIGVGTGGFNAFTMYDFTSYYFKANRHNWPIILTLSADLMSNLRIDEQCLNSEMNAVFQEIKHRRLDTSCDVFAAVFPQNHPYATHHIIGFKDTVLTSHAKGLRDFYNRYYTPDNAALIVVGNVALEDLMSHIDASFGSIKSSPRANSQDKAECFHIPLTADFAQKHLISYSSIPQESTSFLFALPGKQHKQYVASQALSFALNDRLCHTLIDDKDLVKDVWVDDVCMRYGGVFMISLSPKVDADSQIAERDQAETIIKQCKQEIDRHLNDIVHHGLHDDELIRFKQGSMTMMLSNFEYPERIAAQLVDAYLVDPTVKAPFFTYIQKVMDLTNTAIQEYAHEYVRPFKAQQLSQRPIPEQEQEAWLKHCNKLDAHDSMLLASRKRETPVEKPSYANHLTPPEPLQFEPVVPDRIVTLSNGLTVYLKHCDDTPFVCMYLSLKESEQLFRSYGHDAKSFVPHFCLNQLIEGSQRATKREHQEFFERLGAYFSTTEHGIFMRCLYDDFDAVFARGVHILTRPLFPAASLQRDITSRRDHLVRLCQHPTYQAKYLLGQKLYKDYSWVYSDEQYRAQLATYTRKDLVDFAKKFLQPTMMYAVVVGAFNPDTIIDQLEHECADWQQSAQTMFNYVTVPLLHHTPDSKVIEKFLPTDQVVFAGARLTSFADSDDCLCLMLLNEHVNRIMFAIREQTGLFYSLSINLTQGMNHNDTLCFAELCTQVTKNNSAQAEHYIRDALYYVAHNGITHDDLERAKYCAEQALIRTFSSTSSIARSADALIGRGFDVSHAMERIQRMRALTLEQINTAAQTYLDPNSWVFCRVGRVDADHA